MADNFGTELDWLKPPELSATDVPEKASLLSGEAPPVSTGQSALSRTLGYKGTEKDPVFGDTTKYGADWIEPVKQPPADARVEVDLEALQTAGFTNFATSWLNDPTNQEQVKNTPGLNIDIQAMRDAGISDEKIFNTVVKTTPLSGTELFTRGLEEGLVPGAFSFAGARSGAAAVSALPIPPWWKIPAVVVGGIGGGIAGQEAVSSIAGPNDYDRFAVDGDARSVLEAGRTLGLGVPFLRMPFSLVGGVDLGAKAILDSAASQRVRALRIAGYSTKKIEDFLGKWGERAALNPKLTLIGEGSAIIGAAGGAYIAEGVTAGSAGTRLFAEAVGATLSPSTLLINEGSNFFYQRSSNKCRISLSRSNGKDGVGSRSCN